MSALKHREKLKKSILVEKAKFSSKDYGVWGEEIASRLLSQNGYEVIARNFKSRLGEIDIIALKDKCLFFVEVKTRWSLKFGRPEEAVTARKLAKIKKVSQYYSLTHPKLPEKLRLAVVAIEILQGKPVSKKIIIVD